MISSQDSKRLYSPAGDSRNRSVRCGMFGCARSTLNICACCDEHCTHAPDSAVVTTPLLRIGDRVRHLEHGAGTVASGCPRPDIVWVEFVEHQDPRWSIGLIEIVPVSDLTLESAT